MRSAPWLAVVGVLALIFVSLISCAISDAVARLAASLYSGSPELRARRREEWICQLDDMKPSERPAQAASMLWIGVRRTPAGRVLGIQRSLAGRPWRDDQQAAELSERIVVFNAEASTRALPAASE